MTKFNSFRTLNYLKIEDKGKFLLYSNLGNSIVANLTKRLEN
jgi:hypothetical protein